MDELDALDNLVTPPPPPAGPVDAVNDLTEEARARVLAGKAEDEKPHSEAMSALSVAVEAFLAGQKPEGVDAEVAAALAAGLPVDVARLVELGAVKNAQEPAPATTPEELDALTEEAQAAEEKAARPDPPMTREVVDPLVLPEDESLVPVYNPQAAVVDLHFSGQTYPVRAGGVDLCHIEAVKLGVGPDNQGGTLSRYGVRRLFGPEPRFAEAAAKAGVSLLEYARRRNLSIVRMADGIAKRTESTVFDALKTYESRELELPEETAK